MKAFSVFTLCDTWVPGKPPVPMPLRYCEPRLPCCVDGGPLTSDAVDDGCGGGCFGSARLAVEGNGPITPPEPLEAIIIELSGDGAVPVVQRESSRAGDCAEEEKAWKAPAPWLTVRLRIGSDDGGVMVSASASVRAGETALADDVSMVPPLPCEACPAALAGVVLG